LYNKSQEDESAEDESEEINLICNASFVQLDESAEDESEEINLTCNVSIMQLDESDEDEHVVAKVAYTCTDGSASNPWYFDNGCSRHMTCNRGVLSTYTEEASGKVTFVDGGKGRIKGKGNIECVDQPPLANVYYVEGQKANLISISQLWYDGLKVTFTKTDCQAMDENKNAVLSGLRSGNNCYMWTMNVQSLVQIVNAGVVRGVQKLGDKLDSV